MHYLCIQYLQINISEAKGLFVSCLPLLCTAHRGLVKAGQEHGDVAAPLVSCVFIAAW